MRKKFIRSSVIICITVLIIFSLAACSSSGKSENNSNSSSEYESSYYDEDDEDYIGNDPDEAYKEGYNDGLSELESYKEDHLDVPTFVNELIDTGQYSLVQEMLDTDIFYWSAILGDYVGDSNSKTLHSGDCDELKNIPMKYYVIFADNYSNALESGYTTHSCIEDDILDEEDSWN